MRVVHVVPLELARGAVAAAALAVALACLGCASLAQSAADRATGVTPTQRANEQWNTFERRPVNANPNAPTSECVEGAVVTAGVLGGPVGGAEVTVYEDGALAYRATTATDGAFRVCARPETDRVRVEIGRRGGRAQRVEYGRDARPARLDVVLPTS